MAAVVPGEANFLHANVAVGAVQAMGADRTDLATATFGVDAVVLVDQPAVNLGAARDGSGPSGVSAEAAVTEAPAMTRPIATSRMFLLAFMTLPSQNFVRSFRAALRGRLRTMPILIGSC